MHRQTQEQNLLTNAHTRKNKQKASRRIDKPTATCKYVSIIKMHNNISI